MKKVFVAILFFLGAASLSFGQDDFIKDSLDSYIIREMNIWKIPGVAVGIVKDGKVVALKGYGVREMGRTDKIDENTLFQIASNSKAFTGTAIAMLDNEKRLNLDERVRKYLPWFALKDPNATEMVTVKDILCHRIGFSTFQSDFLNWNCNLSEEALIKNMRNVDAKYKFRYKFGYCNMGFVTAGAVIKAVTDTSWQDFFQHRFFDKLAMKRSSVYYSKIISDNNAAKPYTLVNGQLVRLEYANVDNIGACAGINSCVSDLTHWLLMQLNNGRYNGVEVVPETVIKTTRNSYMIDRESSSPPRPYNHFANYGLGWELEDMYGSLVVSHNGGANGFVTNTTLLPEHNAGFVILTNTDANWFYVALRQQLINYFTGQPYANISAAYYKRFEANDQKDQEEIKALEDKTKSNPKLSVSNDAVAGKYKNPVYGEIEIRKSKKGLTMYFSHHPFLKGELTPTGAETLLCKFTDPTYGIHEFPLEIINGKVKSITVKVNDFVDYDPYRFEKNE